jgi:hypothetical protein
VQFENVTLKADVGMTIPVRNAPAPLPVFGHLKNDAAVQHVALETEDGFPRSLYDSKRA